MNITNRCTSDCVFCVKKTSPDSALWLAAEPGADDILQDIKSHQGYEQIVFCGFGEPLLRIDIVAHVAGQMRGQGVTVRIDTNGLAEYVLKRPVLEQLQGLCSTISVSLVAHDAATYARLTGCPGGTAAYAELLKFIKRAAKLCFDLELTVVSVPEVDIEACRKIARKVGARFRVRNRADRFFI